MPDESSKTWNWWERENDNSEETEQSPTQKWNESNNQRHKQYFSEMRNDENENNWIVLQ